MSDGHDPPRLRLAGDSPPELARALELARQGLPDAARMERLEAGVLAALVASEAPPSAPRARRSMRRVAVVATTSFKLLFAAAVAASGLGAAVFVFVTRSSEPTAPASPKALIGARAPDPGAGSGAKRQEIIPFEVQETPGAAASAAPATKPGSPAVVRAPKEPLAPGSAAPSTTGVGPPVGAAAFSDPGGTEVTLLGRAQQSLAADPAAALALTVEHARSFPSGTLAQEREVIAIEALHALGQSSAAAARAARFRAAYPTSAHLRRLEALFGAPAHATP